MNKVTSDKKESPARRRMLASALALFRRYGLRKATVEDICREAGVSRMTFYRNFADKDEIAIEALGGYFAGRMDEAEAILAEPVPFEERLRKIFLLKAEGLRTAGEEMIRDVLGDRASAPGRYLGALFAEQTRRTREIFLSLQKKGEIRKDLHVDLIMYILEHAWNAFADEGLTASYQDKTRLYGELFQAIYYGILPARKNRERR